MPGTALVFLSETLHGLTAGIITPCIAAISLGLVGRRAMSLRTGRNFRYAAAGHAVTADLLGAAGTYFSLSAIFVTAAALWRPWRRLRAHRHLRLRRNGAAVVIPIRDQTREIRGLARAPEKHALLDAVWMSVFR